MSKKIAAPTQCCFGRFEDHFSIDWRLNTTEILYQALDLQSEPIKADNPAQTDQLRRNDPVFYINKRTNITVHLRRKKLKSIRRTNFECLMRRVLKEKLEYNESRVIQDKMKVIHDSVSGKKQVRILYFVINLVSSDGFTFC